MDDIYKKIKECNLMIVFDIIVICLVIKNLIQ